MLPKVATTILHSTSRAASAVPNQSYAIKNFIQLQSNSGPSGNRGGNGPSSGGYRYQTGSRGYHTPGRAAAQGGICEANDGSALQADDGDDAPQPAPRLRRASTSFTLAERLEQRRPALGVLTAVKQYARAFSSVETPVRTGSRRNSMSAVDSSTSLSDASVPPPPPLGHARSSSPVTPPSVRSGNEAPTLALSNLMRARELDAPSAAAVVMDFRVNANVASVIEFNAALEALYHTRVPGEPLTLFLETYNDMVNRGLVPDTRTYIVLILALTDRDHEVVGAIRAIERRLRQDQDITRQPSLVSEDVRNLELFMEERNASSAMALWRACVARPVGGKMALPQSVYRNLLRACAERFNETGMVDSAIQVWSQMERSMANRIPIGAFQWMIKLYGNLGDFAGAQEVFKEFKRSCNEGQVALGHGDVNAIIQTMTWNSMIQAAFQCGEVHFAIELLDEMLGAAAQQIPDDSSKLAEGVYAPAFDCTQPASPSPSSFYLVIAGFCEQGDIQSAWSWFHRLLELPHSSATVDDSQPTLSPLRPNVSTWRRMIQTMVHAGEVEKVNKLYSTMAHYEAQDRLALSPADVKLVFSVNQGKIASLASQGNIAYDQLSPFVDAVASLRAGHMQSIGLASFEKVAILLVESGFVEEGVAFFASTVRFGATLGQPIPRQQVVNFITKMFGSHREKIPFLTAIALARLAESVQYTYPVDFTTYTLNALGKEDTTILASLDVPDWIVLLNAATCLEVMPPNVPLSFCPHYTFDGVFSLLKSLASQVGTQHSPFAMVSRLSPKTMNAALAVCVSKLGDSVVRDWLTSVGHGELFDEMVTPSQATEASETSSLGSDSGYETVATSPVLSASGGDEYTLVFRGRQHERLVRASAWKADPKIALDTLQSIFQAKQLPSFSIAVRFAKIFERAKWVDAGETLLQMMMHVEPQNPGRSAQWISFLDSMIIFFAQVGKIDRAHALRQQILEAGAGPSGDAYGALIYFTRETSDDAANALALYHESRLRGVAGTPYLYNNIISKVAKARKADLALELFNQMKTCGVPTSSITYGAVIGACVRVGDALSAEALFEEMVEQPNFQARIPPYNTMMQLYTTTKPNKERALHYYDALIASGVTPTSYTYKLLIDAHMLEPVKIERAEEVFRSMLERRDVHIEGQHIAAMINAYGCVRKDLDKAVETFDAAPAYLKNGYDAIMFEAMFNVIMAHRRTDLIAPYLQKMEAANVHMTAYVVNVVVRAYAIDGEIQQARDIFEALADPPHGMAALYNHTPHGATTPVRVDPSAPVFREPSTWEVMIRAELGQGHRDRAVALLERLQERHYPEAVFNRISGILVDHSALPGDVSV